MGVALASASAGCATSQGSQRTAIGSTSLGRDLKGSVAEITDRSKDAMKEMGVQITESSSKKSGQQYDLAGKSGAHNVSIEVHDIGNGMSHVEVSAKDGGLQWNQDYAKAVLDKIIAKS